MEILKTYALNARHLTEAYFKTANEGRIKWSGKIDTYFFEALLNFPFYSKNHQCEYNSKKCIISRLKGD